MSKDKKELTQADSELVLALKSSAILEIQWW